MGSKSDKEIDIADPFARQLMARYLKRREIDVKKLKAALRGTDFEAIRMTGHNLFGSGGAYGLDEISDLGRSIEAAAEECDARRVEALIGDLERFLENLTVR